MAFTTTRGIILCVIIICSHFLITVYARNFKSSSENSTPTTLHEDMITQNSIVEDRSLVDSSSGRSLLIKGMLLAPVGILLLILAGFVLLPVPVIATGRALKYNNRAIDLAKKVITSDECIERISCEISNVTRNYQVISWIPRTIESYMKNSSWIEKASRGFHTLDSCRQFKCHPMKSISKLE